MYRLFISHSWAYGDRYDRLIELIENGGVAFYDHSVPQYDPIHTNGSDEELRDAIRAKMRGVSAVVVLAGVYASYSRWIKEEIEIALEFGKPIIAVEYWGAQRTSRVVKNAADVVVRWQSASIAGAITDYA